MRREMREIALGAGIGGLGQNQIEKFAKAIATRCLDVFDKYEPKFAIKKIKEEFELEDSKDKSL